MSVWILWTNSGKHYLVYNAFAFILIARGGYTGLDGKKSMSIKQLVIVIFL